MTLRSAVLAVVLVASPLSGGMPVAVISAWPLSAACGQPVVFDGTRSYCTDATVVVQFRWEFDTGASLPGSRVSYVFPSHGTHRVELWITDASGRSAIEEVLIGIAPGNPAPGAEPGPSPEGRFDPARLAVVALKAGWGLVDVSKPAQVLVSFGPEGKFDADLARQVLQHYRIDTQRPIGHSGLVLFLAAGQAPEGAFPEEQALAFDPQALRVERRSIPAKAKSGSGGDWVLTTEGTRPLWGFCGDEAHAREAWRIIRQYGFTHLCRAGGFWYWRK